jgi:hypothetical protein
MLGHMTSATLAEVLRLPVPERIQFVSRCPARKCGSVEEPGVTEAPGTQF